MITTNVIHRVFKLMSNNQTGTMFTVEVDNKQYLITAKHLVEDINNQTQAKIYLDNGWKDINLTLLEHCPNDIDISVLITDKQLTPSGLPCEPTSVGIILGQDVYFLGFPYDITPKGGTFNNGYPCPFIKKAILSSIFKENDKEIVFLDGHNNPGFSGGPIVYKVHNQTSFQICGVISGYRAQNQPTYISGSPTNIYFQENTGIILGYGINQAIKVIQNNPIGFPL